MNYSLPKHIGDYNKNQIISILRENEQATRVELAHLLGISAPAVSRNISKLLKAGIIRECGVDTSAVGRKPVLLELVEDYCYVVAADVVGGSIKVALANLMGEITYYSELPFYPSGGTMFEQLTKHLDSVLHSAGIVREKIRALVVGTPGIFDAQKRKSRLTMLSDGWDEIDLEQRLSEQYNVPTIVENDVTLDVLGEGWKGSGQSYDNIFYVKLGQGFAARAVLNGELLSGHYNAAGEIGYMMPGPGKGPNYEELLHNAGLVQQYKKLAPDSSGSPETLSDLLTLRKKGDIIATSVVQQMLEHLWVVLLNCTTVLNPQVIVIGGDGGYLSQEDLGYLTQRIEQHFPMETNILTSGLDKKACIFGGIDVGLRYVDNQILEGL